MSEEERPLEPLVIGKDAWPVTASGEVGCVMLVTTGSNDDLRWFHYRTDYFVTPTIIEWPNDTMEVVLPGEVVRYLFDNRYARPMTAAEVKAYNKQINSKEKETKS